MRGDRGVHDGQTEAAATPVAGPRRIGAVEALGRPLEDIGRHAVAAVDHVDVAVDYQGIAMRYMVQRPVDRMDDSIAAHVTDRDDQVPGLDRVLVHPAAIGEARKADLRQAFLSPLPLGPGRSTQTHLGSARMRYVMGQAADLSEAVLDGADLRGADFTGARTAKASFREVDLTQVQGLDFSAG